MDRAAKVVEIEVEANISVQPRKTFQRYKREWEKLPIFKDWLTPVPSNRHKAYCKFCHKEFRAHRTDLRAHARSKKHQKAGDAYFSESVEKQEFRKVATSFKKEHQSPSVAGRSKDTIAIEKMEDDKVEVEVSYITNENHDEEEEEEEKQLEEEEDEEEMLEEEVREAIISKTDKNEGNTMEDGCKASSANKALSKESEGTAIAKGISTQVLDLVRGMPVSRLGVTLLMECGSTWSKIADGITDKKGHCALLKPEEVVQGRYKINYEVKKYFTLGLHDTIYPYIEVTFDIGDLQDDYHVPLLLSPCGYMVYRVR